MLTIAEIDSYLQKTYARTQIILERGEGCKVWDTEGREYLDFVAGIAVCSLGHASPVMRSALAEQSAKLIHTSNLYYTLPQAELAKWLIENSCADRAFFCNSGGEANEGAVKLARKYSHLQHGDAEPVIITAQQSFHGRTLAMVTATGQEKYQKGFEPLMPGFEYVPYNDAKALDAAVSKIGGNRRLAGIMLEPLQGEGGVTPGAKDFFAVARRLCDQHDAALIFDEVQTGMGRTGKLWAYEHLGVEPDIFTAAKGLGGGIPIGAMLAKNRVAIFQPGEHATTFGGNPLATAVALSVSKTIGAPDFLSHVKERGEELHIGLEKLIQKHPAHFEKSRGWGLIQGLVLKESSSFVAATVIARAFERGLLVVGAGPKVIRLVPPLIVSSKEIQKALSVLEEVFA
jgi:acetylornithine aminotransferase